MDICARLPCAYCDGLDKIGEMSSSRQLAISLAIFLEVLLVPCEW